jgi:cobalt-zinc-cadmium efflux system protein
MASDSHNQNRNHESCSHHGPGPHSHAQGLALNLSLAATVAFVAIEGGLGYRAHSLALMSDAGHNFSDALSLGFSAFAVWIARKPANSKNTFGYHRVAILTALLNSLALALISCGIVIQAARALADPAPIDSPLMLMVAAVALVVNTSIVWALHGGAKHSLNIRATYIHMATDVISSILVLAVAFAISRTHLTILDPLASIAIAILIFASCWKIVREATDILLESSPRGLDVKALVDRVQSLPHVQALHDLHVWTVSDGLNYLSCHIEVADTQSMAQCADITRAVNIVLRDEFGIVHSTIQMEMAGACDTSDEMDPLFCGGATPRPLPRPALHRNG